MPYADPEERRRYDRERKRSLRAGEGQDPRVVPAGARLRAIEDVQGLLAEAVGLVRSDRRASGVQKARALAYLCSVGLRLIEAHQLEDRLEALEHALRLRSALSA